MVNMKLKQKEVCEISKGQYRSSHTSTFVLRGGTIKEGCKIKSPCHVFRDVFCQQGVFNPSNQPFSQDYMWRLQVPHAKQRHSTIKMINFRHMLRTNSTMLSKCQCLKICAFLRHRPRFPYTSYVWESLKNHTTKY